MPKLKHGVIFPTPEEDAAITAAAESDPDARPLTDAEWELVRPTLRRGEKARPVETPQEHDAPGGQEPREER